MFNIFNKEKRLKEKNEKNFRNGNIRYLEYLQFDEPNEQDSLKDYIEYYLVNIETSSDSKFSKNFIDSISKYEKLTELLAKLKRSDIDYEVKKTFFEKFLEIVNKDYHCRSNFYKDDEDCKFLFKVITNKVFKNEDTEEDNEYQEAKQLYEMFFDGTIHKDGNYKYYLNFIGEPFVKINYLPVWEGITNGEQPYNGSFEIDYNNRFVQLLKDAGIEGEDDETITDNWFSNVCVMLSVAFIQDKDDPDSFQSLFDDDPASTIVENFEINPEDYDTDEEYQKAKDFVKNKRQYR